MLKVTLSSFCGFYHRKYLVKNNLVEGSIWQLSYLEILIIKPSVCFKLIVSDLMCRAEQSEVLTEDVQSAEKHVEVLKQTCGTMSRKISSVLSSEFL